MPTDIAVTNPPIEHIVLDRKSNKTFIDLGVRLVPSILLRLSITCSLDLSIPIRHISLPSIRLRSIPEIEGVSATDFIESHFVFAVWLDGRRALAAAAVAVAPAFAGPVV